LKFKKVEELLLPTSLSLSLFIIEYSSFYRAFYVDMNRLLSTPSALKIRPFQTKVFISQRKRLASCLVVSEHDQSVISPATLSTITAASKIGGEV
jgi:hypothetical protein